MMNRISRIAVLMTVLTAMAGVQAARAEAPSMTDSDATSTTVRVLNNYGSAVRVFLKDSEGNSHLLGRVARAGLQTFEIPESLVKEGSNVEITAYPVGLISGVSPTSSAYRGVSTSTIELAPGQRIDFWLERVLSSSTAKVAEF